MMSPSVKDVPDSLGNHNLYTLSLWNPLYPSCWLPHCNPKLSSYNCSLCLHVICLPYPGRNIANTATKCSKHRQKEAPESAQEPWPAEMLLGKIAGSFRVPHQCPSISHQVGQVAPPVSFHHHIIEWCCHLKWDLHSKDKKNVSTT
jgi:hypothetical protein